MEHYVIFIWNRPFCEQDYVLISDYLSALFPSELQYQQIACLNEEIAALLKPVSEHIAVLNANQANEKVEWMCMNQNLSLKDFISKEIVEDDHQNELPTKKVVEQISAALHSLADQLPAFGTYRLDVLLGSDVLRNLSVRKEPVLGGAFIRLTRWHSAHFTIAGQTEYDVDKLNEWCEIINAHIIPQNNALKMGPCLWRGAISTNSVDNTFYGGFQLKFYNRNERHIPYSFEEDTKFKNFEHIVLSSKLQIIKEVSFASIPPYLFSPVIFNLCLSRLNVLNKKSFKFVDYLSSNKEVALILRLEYAEINSKTKPEKRYSTSRWQRAILSRTLKDPQCFVSSFDKFITFAVTKSKNSDHILAYPLQKASLDASFFFNLVNHRVSSLACEVSKKNYSLTNENILAGVPFINTDSFSKIMNKYVNQNESQFKNSLLSTSAQNDSDCLHVNEDVKSFPTPFSFEAVNASNILLEEIDPSDWPERIRLLNKQMQNEAKECIPASSLLGQSLKLSQQSFTFSSDFMSRYFLPSGEPKNLSNAESVHQLNTDHLPNYDRNKVFQSKWPEIMDCIYHDMYYNSSSQTEDKESLGSEMIKLYVQHETASTCSNQQVTQNFSIFVADKSSTPKKEFRSPSCRAANTVKGKRFESKHTSPKEHSLKDLITKKILSSSRSSSAENVSQICQSVSSSKSKKNLNKSLAPVRCSPRKMKPVNYKYPSVNRNMNNTKNGQHSKSNDIPDLLKKKIRHAVATALENNGIALTHEHFKPCGSKLFYICKTFLDDISLKKGKTSNYLQKIADAHVKQVIEFYQG